MKCGAVRLQEVDVLTQHIHNKKTNELSTKTRIS